MAKTNSTVKQPKKSEGCHCGEHKTSEKNTKSRAKSNKETIDCK